MKKLKLIALELGAKEVLTREQLKKIVGGNYDSGSSGYCKFRCCTDEHTNCSEYVSSSYACSSASDCNGSMASCSSGHLFWTCGA